MMNYIQFLGESSYSEKYIRLCTTKTTNNIVEKHHILPKSIFEDLKNDTDNIVSLSLRDHFLAHELLYLHYKEIAFGSENYMKMATAYSFMSNRFQIKTPQLYEETRLIMIQYNKNKVIVKNEKGENIKISSEEYKLGNYESVSSGKTTVKDKDGNCFAISTEDERLKTGEFVGVAKGMVTVKDKNGNKLVVSVDDEKYINGEYVHVACDYLYDIYDNHHNLIFTFTSLVKDCIANNLPYRQLKNSLYNNSSPIFMTTYPQAIAKLKKTGNIKYVGWYVKRRKIT